MIYLLYGDNKYQIEKEIKKIIDDSTLTDIDINRYDLNEISINDIIEDAMTISLFNNNKIIIIKDNYIFTGNSPKNSIEHNIDILENYLKDPNPNTILIFVVNNSKLDQRKKIVKNINEKATVKNFNKPNNLNNIVKEMFGDYNISNKDIFLLIDRVGNNLEILEQEIIKIKIYKDDDKNITSNDIINLTNKNIDADIFELIDAVINRDKEKAIEIYNELLKLNEESIKIIVILANQIRIIYQAKELYKIGYTGKDIASNLNIHPYRISLALEKGREYSSEVLLTYLEKLAELDFNIKSGTIDKDIGLELFILSI